MMLINKMIVLIIAIIVLIAVILILSGTVTGIGLKLGTESELRQCCQKYIANGCPDIWKENDNGELVLDDDGNYIIATQISCNDKTIDEMMAPSNSRLRAFCDC